jgi:hypothetical protein
MNSHALTPSSPPKADSRLPALGGVSRAHPTPPKTTKTEADQQRHYQDLATLMADMLMADLLMVPDATVPSPRGMNRES